MEGWHGLYSSTGEIALSAHKVSIDRVYPFGQTVPGSNHSREVLEPFDGTKVTRQYSIEPFMTSILPEGTEVSGGNFTGTVWVNMIILPDDNLNTTGGKVKFEPKARSNWHSHPGGQILIVTDGTGYHQIEEKPIQIIREGNVIKVPANAKHWHGGSHEQSMTHTAIVPDLDKGRTSWAGPVTDEEYNSIR